MSNVDETSASDESPLSNAAAQEESREDGLTIREAALKSGMTEKMIRVRIRNGTIDSWRVQGKFGMEWRVRLPEGEYDVADDETGEETETPVTAGASTPAPKENATTARPPIPVETGVPVELFRTLMIRHEEMAIRLGRAEAQLETFRHQEEEKPTSQVSTEDEPLKDQKEAPSQSVERLQRIARGEAEARYKAEAEVARMQEQLNAAEAMINEMKAMLQAVGG